jgi:hypothetical protein
MDLSGIWDAAVSAWHVFYVSWSGAWPDMKDFFNSVFFSSIIGAAAGAYAGAYGAQLIVEGTKYREQLLKEIRDTNAASAIAFGVTNSLVAIKKQHVKPLKQNLDAQKAALLEHLRKINSGEIAKGTEFVYNADLQTLSLPPLSVDILQRQIFEKLSLVGRPLHLTTTIAQTLHGLNASLEKRNELIASYKAGRPALTAPLYFGFPQQGVVNEDYPSSVNAIYRQTDDGIFFAQLLCKDLTDHGNQLKAKFAKQFGKGAPNIADVDFSKAEQEGLMPDPTNYSDWFTAFKKKPTA